MAKEKLKSLITAFTPDGNYLAILSPDGTVKVWNTSNGSQFAEWSGTEEISDVSFSCMACSFIGKMRRKERGTCLVALGTNNGDISVVNISVGQMMWKSTAHHPGGVASLSFRSKGRRLHVVGKSGGASEMMSETGELTREFKISKKSIAAVALCEDKIVAAIGHNIRILSWDDGKEVLKFSSNLDQLRSISSSDDTQFIVASGVGEKSLHVWKCNFGTRDVSNGLVLPLKHRPLRIECKNSCDGEDGLIVLSVSEAGVVYLWKLKSVSDEVNPTKISIKDDTSAADSLTSGGAKKNRVSIIAARIHALETCGLVKALISFGSVDSPQFSIVDIDRPDQEIIITATDIAMQENGLQVEEGQSNQKEKSRKKRAASDLEIASGTDNGHGDAKDGIHIDYDLDEPTMGDKLANLNLVEVAAKSQEKIESSPCTQPPSADSVHVLLKQALHADDRALLIDCLYRQDEKVVANSVSLLNPSDVLKLLQSLVSIIQSRGAVLVCALPWLRSLLLQHASGIMSQESSLLALNTLYQLIESRVSTFNQTLQLSSSLDLLYAGTVDDGIDENEIITPAFYEDKDESDEDVSADAMETESDESGQEPEILTDISDFEGME